MKTIVRSRLLRRAAAALGSGILASARALAAPAARGPIFISVYNNSTVRECAYDGTYTPFAASPDVNSPIGLAVADTGFLYTTALILGSQGKIDKFARRSAPRRAVAAARGPRVRRPRSTSREVVVAVPATIRTSLRQRASCRREGPRRPPRTVWSAIRFAVRAPRAAGWRCPSPRGNPFSRAPRDRPRTSAARGPCRACGRRRRPRT